MKTEDFLTEWHRIVRERDLPALAPLLAPDVELGAPPYWEPLRGAALVQHLLGLILETVEGFTYHREWKVGSELALEFRGKVGGLELQGIDLFSLDAEGRIRRLDVPMRPVNAVIALREAIAPRMAAYLAKKNG
ncbi:MAG: nuclear transport factor 2 family protein [Myxococcota bacterium]